MTHPTAVAVAEVADNVHRMREALEAYGLFRDGVGALMLRLAEERDGTALVLLELLRDLESRTAELFVEEEHSDDA